MNDQEIFNLICKCINDAKSKGYYIVSDPLNVTWNINKWESNDKLCCPLSSLLITHNIIPDVRLIKSDDLKCSTIAIFLNKNESWINSFICAIQGKQNEGTSISGYILGLKIKKLFNI